MAFNQNVFNHIINSGGSHASANNAARANRPGRALANWQRDWDRQQAAARAAANQRRMYEDMQRRQNDLLKAAMNTPKTNKALRSRTYEPKFRASVSDREAKRAVSKGTYQFANPLAMGLGGSGFGGGTGPNLGG